MTVLPRADVGGAIGAALLAVYLIRGRAPEIYAGVFLVVAWLELYGTAIGTWEWAVTIPGTGVPQGNPPSGVASGYVWFDIVALALAPRSFAGERESDRALGLCPTQRELTDRADRDDQLLRLALLRVRDEREEAVAGLGGERLEPEHRTVGELDLDHRLLEPVLGRERLDPAVDPRRRDPSSGPAIPGVQSSGIEPRL